MIWVREDLRRMVLASQLIKDLSIESTTRQLEGSESFWRARL